MNDKAVAARDSSSLESDALVAFLERIISWWNILNVENAFKGQAKRLFEATPVVSQTDDRLVFLETFWALLDSRDAFQFRVPVPRSNSKRADKLSNETSFAL